MATRRNLPVVVRPLAAAALAATVPLTLAMTAGLAVGQGTTAVSGVAAIEEARRLIDNGRPIQARAMLARMYQDAPTAEARANLSGLLEAATLASRRLDANEASLQKARVALDEGDVRLADRHARAVHRSATAKPDQVDRAQGLLDAADRRRAEFAPIVSDTLAQAERDFLAGKYAESKAGFEMVDRSGVKLQLAQQSTLDRYQMKLVELAAKEPSLFGRSGDLGLMQPGVVRRREDQPADAPVNLPENNTPATPVAQPETPASQPPAAQPPAGDPTAQAMQTEAASLLSQADKAFDERKLNEAAGKYSRLRNEFRGYLTPEQQTHVENRLAEARLVLSGGTAPQPGEDLGQVIKDRTIKIFNNEMTMAQAALDSGNPADARDHRAKAQLQLNSTRQYFPESEFENMTKRLDEMLAAINTTEQQLFQSQQQRRDEQIRQDQAKVDTEVRAERERKIVELIDRARAYQSELRYREALEAVNQLLFLDPINPTGLLLRDAYNDILVLQRGKQVYELKQEKFAELSKENQEASIPDPSIINFPTDWPEVSVGRGESMAFADSKENRRVLAELGSTRIPSVNFSDNSLQDVVTFVQGVTKQNIDVDWLSLEQANIQRETTISLNLTNVTVKGLLDRIIEKVSGPDSSSRADWSVKEGVVTIASEEKIRKDTVLVIYDIHDLIMEVPDYTDVPRIDLQQALQAAQGGGGGGGQSPFREQGNDDQQQRGREREEKITDIISIIESNIDNEGWENTGGTTGKIQQMGTSANLIVTNTPKNHRAIAGLLSKLREVRSMQINVETRFLLVNQDFFEQIGFDLDVYLNASNNQVLAARTTNPSALASDLFTNGRLNHNPGAASGSTGNPIPANSWSPIAFQQDSLGLAGAVAPRSDWSDAILAASPALGIGGQFLDDIQVDFLVQATQADRRSIQLTAPRLTFTNGQIANIYVATQTAFVSDLQPIVGDSAVGFDPTVGVVTEGVTLLVEGTVTADRRYVTMNVDAGVARVDGFAQQAVTAVTGGQLINSRETQSFIQLPKITVTRVRTTVTVPDQGTILMGGQRLITEYEVETGVPVLSKIPIINRFFTNRLESREEQTLLILMKPTILIQNEEEERNFPGLLDSLRTGLGG